MKVYAAYYENEIRLESSSGGIFSVLASKFDIVYGVSMSEDCYACEFIRCENNIASLRGSKYFQAKVGDTFKRVKEDLDNNRKVLFSGTGCQINGLSSYLNKEYPNLFLLDVICHGVPSPKLWKEYVLYQERKYGKLKKVNFRCKDDSWEEFGMKENQLYSSKDKDSFMKMFLRDYCLRPSCYECHAKYYKKSDMTIADFWGIEKVAPNMDDGNGTSVVLCRTLKGTKLFELIKPQIKWLEVEYEEAVRENPSEYKSVIRPFQRDTFFGDLNNLSFEEIEKKYAYDIRASFPRRCMRKLKSIAKKIVSGGGNSDYGILFVFKER